MSATPIFDLTDHFDTTVPIGDKRLPIHVKRYSKGELEVFEKKYAAFVAPRGTEEPDAAAKVKREDDIRAFFEDAIREAITLDEGLVRDRGKWVTDGAGLIGVFHARQDVLTAFLTAIVMENRLGSVIRKNSNSPRASEPGSDDKIPERGGDRQGSTAASAAPSTTAATAAATDGSDGSADNALPSSGAPSEETKVH